MDAACCYSNAQVKKTWYAYLLYHLLSHPPSQYDREKVIEKIPQCSRRIKGNDLAG